MALHLTSCERVEPDRELALLYAAEEVLARCRLGACGLPEALKALDIACDSYPELEA